VLTADDDGDAELSVNSDASSLTIGIPCTSTSDSQCIVACNGPRTAAASATVTCDNVSAVLAARSDGSQMMQSASLPAGEHEHELCHAHLL